jgi:uncharacterized protein DUF998
VLEPELDPRWRFISEYAVGRFGWLMAATFVLAAISLLGAVVAVLSQVRTVVGYGGLAILVVSAAGFLLAATFRTDPWTTSANDLTTSGKLHVLGASLDWTPVAALLISLSLARNAAWKATRTALYVTAGLTLVVMVAFILTTTVWGPPNGIYGPGTITGLVGRLLVLSYTGWLVAAGWHVLGLRRTRPALAYAP